jgi:hypothetical protein
MEGRQSRSRSADRGPIVSGGAGPSQMRGRALSWVYTERLVHKPAPATRNRHLMT